MLMRCALDLGVIVGTIILAHNYTEHQQKHYFRDKSVATENFLLDKHFTCHY